MRTTMSSSLSPEPGLPMLSEMSPVPWSMPASFICCAWTLRMPSSTSRAARCQQM